VRIRMLEMVTGAFHHIEGGVARGAVVELDDVSARRYIKAGRAAPADEDESAVVDLKAESAVVKRGTRRKKPDPEWHDEQAPGWKKTESDA
jgi:hypothetical protein